MWLGGSGLAQDRACSIKVLINPSSLFAMACTSAWVGGLEAAQTTCSLNPRPIW